MYGFGFFKPRNIEVVFDRIYADVFSRNPEFFRSNIDSIIVHSDLEELELADYSPSGFAKRIEDAVDWASHLEKFERNKLKPQQKIAATILSNSLRNLIQYEPTEACRYPITHVWGPHLENLELFSKLPLQSKADIENYLRLLSDIEPQMGDLIDALEQRRKKEVIPPTFVLKQVIAQCDMIATSPADSILFYRVFADKLNDISLLNPQAKANYLNDCSAILKESVIPSYIRITAYLLQLERSSLSISGIWQYQNGSDHYRNRIYRYTESTNAPVTLYEIAKVELTWLEGEMQIIRELSKRGQPIPVLAQSSSEITTKMTSMSGTVWFVKNLPAPSITEGWALYSEARTIASENESSTKQYVNYLKRNREATCRMMVDLGIHEKKWLREQAIEFYSKHTETDKNTSTVLVDRIIVDPGRATAAKIGLMRFLELEELAKKELNENFNSAELSTVFTQNGPTTFGQIEEQVLEYIRSKSE